MSPSELSALRALAWCAEVHRDCPGLRPSLSWCPALEHAVVEVRATTPSEVPGLRPILTTARRVQLVPTREEPLITFTWVREDGIQVVLDVAEEVMPQVLRLDLGWRLPRQRQEDHDGSL